MNHHNEQTEALDRPQLAASIPFILTHVACALAFVVGFSWRYVVIALVSYYVRMFGVTAGYHRYFSHRAFQTNRVFQFLLAWLAQTSSQKGALWWAANHRHHHRFSDQPEDIHSPTLKGFWWSHVGWILSERYEKTNYDAIKDFSRFPELVWLNTFWLVPPLTGLAALALIGGLPLVVWGGIIPTVALWHGTFTINSLSHIFGGRRYLTTDTSKNNFLFALLTCGEGWHNNHHYHQNTANQGWFWWQVDFTYYALVVLSWVGVVRKLRLPSDATRYADRNYTAQQRADLKRPTWFHVPPTPTPAPMPAVLQPAAAHAK